MSNPWFSATGNPAAATRGLSATVRAEFTLLQTAFDSAYAASVLRGLKAGETWTGTHDFTGATVNFGTVTVPTQANADNSTSPANTAWVNTYVTGVAFAAALPSQTGNSGKFVSTNGVTASWTALPPITGSTIYLNNAFGGF